MINFSQKKWIIFDLDGTIAKLGVDWLGCRKEVRTILIEKYPHLEEKLKEKEFELKRQDKKLTLEMMGWLAYHFLGKDVYVDFKEIQEKYEISPANSLQINDEVVAFIKQNENNFKFAICSNNSFKGIQMVLKELDIISKFEIIESRIVDRPPKPESQILDDILKKINNQKKEIIYVGDNDFADKMLAEGLGIDYLDIVEFEKLIG